MSTINNTRYTLLYPNERLDLVDVAALEGYRNETLKEDTRGLLSTRVTGAGALASSRCGHVMFGFSAASGGGLDWDFAAVPGLAVDVKGHVLIREGSAPETVGLDNDINNFIYAFYSETPDVNDVRRFFVGGIENASSVDTATKRGVTFYKEAATNVPDDILTLLGDPPVHPTLGVPLIPLYVVTTIGGSITASFDYRPMFAPMTGNLFDAAALETTHNFSPTDTASHGIVSVRSGLAALADRLKNIKQTTNWWDNNFNNITMNDFGTLHSLTNNAWLGINGGASAGANLTLFGSGHPTNANKLYYNANVHQFYSAAGTTTYAAINGTFGTFAVRTDTDDNVAIRNQSGDADLAVVNDLNNAYVPLRLNALPLLISFNSGGQVGIGSSVTPEVGALLDVGTGGSIRSRRFFESVSDYAYNAYIDGIWKYRAGGYAVDLNANTFVANHFCLLTSPIGLAGGTVTWSTMVAVNMTNGYIGLGGNFNPLWPIDSYVGPGLGARFINPFNNHRIDIQAHSNAAQFNPLSTAGDQVITFSKNGINTGVLVIAPWASTAIGLSVSNTGNVGINDRTWSTTSIAPYNAAALKIKLLGSPTPQPFWAYNVAADAGTIVVGAMLCEIAGYNNGLTASIVGSSASLAVVSSPTVSSFNAYGTGSAGALVLSGNSTQTNLTFATNTAMVKVNAVKVVAGGAAACEDTAGIFTVANNGSDRFFVRGNGDTYTGTFSTASGLISTSRDTTPDCSPGGLNLNTRTAARSSPLNNASGYWAAFKHTSAVQPFVRFNGNTFGVINSATDGSESGLGIMGVSATTGPSSPALCLAGWAGQTTISTTILDGSRGVVHITGSKNDTGNPGLLTYGGATADDENLFTVANDIVTMMILKASGALYTKVSAGGAGNTVGNFDDEKDAIACKDLAYVMAKKKLDKVIEYNQEKLEKLGILVNGYLHQQGATALMLGAIGEIYLVLDELMKRQGCTYEEIRKIVRPQPA